MKISNEYHSNGDLAYRETIKLISESEYRTGNYPNCRVAPCGTKWVRVGLNAKYHDNGVMAWGIQYDNFGNIDKTTNFPSMRKDGSIINY